jgi:hypothetical protein
MSSNRATAVWAHPRSNADMQGLKTVLGHTDMLER